MRKFLFFFFPKKLLLIVGTSIPWFPLITWGLNLIYFTVRYISDSFISKGWLALSSFFHVWEITKLRKKIYIYIFVYIYIHTHTHTHIHTHTYLYVLAMRNKTMPNKTKKKKQKVKIFNWGFQSRKT